MWLNGDDTKCRRIHNLHTNINTADCFVTILLYISFIRFMKFGPKLKCLRMFIKKFQLRESKAFSKSMARRIPVILLTSVKDDILSYYPSAKLGRRAGFLCSRENQEKVLKKKSGFSLVVNSIKFEALVGKNCMKVLKNSELNPTSFL